MTRKKPEAKPEPMSREEISRAYRKAIEIALEGTSALTWLNSELDELERASKPCDS